MTATATAPRRARSPRSGIRRGEAAAGWIFTLPVIEALRHEGAMRDRLLSLLNRRVAGAGELDEAVELIRLLGGLAAAEQVLRGQVEIARELGRRLPLPAAGYLVSIVDEVERSVAEND